MHRLLALILGGFPLFCGAQPAYNLPVKTASIVENSGTILNYTLVLTQHDPNDSRPSDEVDTFVSINVSPRAGKRFDFQGEDFVLWRNGELGPKTVFITALDDFIANAASVYTLRHQASAAGSPAVDLTLTVIDDDVPGLNVSALQPTATIVENGAQALRFDVSLASQPISPVTITPQAVSGQYSIAPAFVVFDISETDWRTKKEFVVNAVDDGIVETRLTVYPIRLDASSPATTSTPIDVNYNRVVERQTVTATASSTTPEFQLGFSGELTSNLDIGTTAAALKTALEALGGIDTITVTRAVVSGGTSWTIEFVGHAGNVPELTFVRLSPDVTVTVATPRQGVPLMPGAQRLPLRIIDDDSLVHVSSVVASNTGSNPGPAVQDTLSIIFSEATNRPDMSSKALIDAAFGFALLGTDYAGTWPWEDFGVTVTATAGSTIVEFQRQSDSIIELQNGDKIRIEGAEHTIVTGAGTDFGTTTISISPAYAGSTGSSKAVRVQSRKQLDIVLVDTRNIGTALELKVGVFEVALRTAAATTFTDVFGASRAATGERVVISGNWGALEVPRIVHAYAPNFASAAGISDGDSIQLGFQSTTNGPTAVRTRLNFCFYS